MIGKTFNYHLRKSLPILTMSRAAMEVHPIYTKPLLKEFVPQKKKSLGSTLIAWSGLTRSFRLIRLMFFGKLWPMRELLPSCNRLIVWARTFFLMFFVPLPPKPDGTWFSMEDAELQFGLLHDDYTPKPAFDTFCRLIQKFGNSHGTTTSNFSLQNQYQDISG